MKHENNQMTTIIYHSGDESLLDEMGAHTKTVLVAVGNEKAFNFYERFGFYPRKTQLEQIKMSLSRLEEQISRYVELF